MKCQHTKAHTFASRTSQHTDQSLQKSVLFSNPRRNSFFFFPPFGVLIFFHPHKPRQTSNQSISLLQTLTGQRNLTRTTEARTGNMRLASCGVKCLNSSLVFQINFSAGLTVWCSEIPHERQAQKRWQQLGGFVDSDG
jgi:hypothetical protein